MRRTSAVGGPAGHPREGGASARKSDHCCHTVLWRNNSLGQRPAQDQFYGDRDGYIIDPFGHGWAVASHVEDVTPDEMARRMAELYG